MNHLDELRRNRAGVTLIELITVLTIIAFLTSLSLPAVLSSREASRLAACRNNLKQIGIAVQTYEGSWSSFPPSYLAKAGDSPFTNYYGYYSLFTKILPGLGEQAAYNALNFMVDTWPTDGYLAGFVPMAYRSNVINSTVCDLTISVLLCPSDGSPSPRHGCNYRGNTGVGPGMAAWAETPDGGNGVFPELRPVRTSRITDGLSQTASVSERVRGSRRQPIDPSRDMYAQACLAFTADQALACCRISAEDSRLEGFSGSGSFWFWCGRERTLYSHTQTPNGRIPDCVASGSPCSHGMSTARSFHAGGVNTLYCDGSVRFSRNSVALNVWRALGTIAGGEIVSP